MKNDAPGLYVHIPFCKRKCAYCDFYSLPGVPEEKMRAYVDALLREIADCPAKNLRPADTVFFGGGTPSLLPAAELSRILDALRARFSVAKDAEITVECNPGAVDRDKLSAYRRAGVNRLSIGLQSASDAECATLGRIHTFADFLSTYRTAREVGFDNINVDLMYAFPGQTEASFRETLGKVLALCPEHISAYSLIVEEGTPFFDLAQKQKMIFPDGDAAYGYYMIANETLREAGFVHYEISNYALPGRECRHNLHYWHGDEYLGFGAAAYSFLDGVRYGNPRDLASYLDGTYPSRRDAEHLDAEGEAYEYAMCAFRLTEGLSLSAYEKKFGKPFLSGREDVVRKYTDAGFLVREGDRLFFTEDALYVENAILVDLL